MFGFSLIIFREVLEICLILAIVIFAAKDMKNLFWLIVAGTSLGVLGSLAIAKSIDAISVAMAGMGQEIFNASILLVTAFFVLGMLLYTTKHAKEMKEKIVKSTGSFWGLLFIVAFTIFREGSEIVLLSHSFYLMNSSASFIVTGLLVGILSGLFFGVLLYFGMAKISPKKIFGIINWLLIFLISGLVVQAVTQLMAADVIMASNKAIWDSSFIISERNILGQILHNLFGYIAKPNFIQIFTYIATFSLTTFLYKKMSKPDLKKLEAVN